ncbi:hypothetical protein OAH84_00490 [Gammaproteobacteria bacterium]|nr:hypothetical protein [Gammaproteobacteria bacterium]MDC1074374.1 hypothetical protein [Gammaproteobacteria bacterium]
MLIQCLSETVTNSWYKVFIDWSDKCAPTSFESLIIVLILIHPLYFLHKFFFYYLKNNNIANNFINIFEQQDTAKYINDLSTYGKLKVFIACVLITLYFIFCLASLYFFADFLLNYFGWTVDKRNSLWFYLSNLFQ